MPFDAFSRRRLLTAGVAALVPGLQPRQALAQPAWPTRPIRLIAPFAAGGGADLIARTVATRLGARLGQTIIVDNRTGAGGVIATDTVAKATPDGHTLLFTTNSQVTSIPTTRQLPYNLLRDLVPVGQVGVTQTLVVVAKDSPLRDFREFIEAARAKPHGVSYGSAGVASYSHLAMALIGNEARVQLLHVPYKGSAPALADLMGGVINAVLISVASGRALLESGRIRGIVTTGGRRSPFLPDLPSMTEVGLPGAQSELWWGLMGPAGMPRAVVTRLNQELQGILAEPAMHEVLAREAASPTPGTPEVFGRVIATELARWTQLVKDTGIQVE